MNYEMHLANRYYRISFNESTAVQGPPIAHFEARIRGGPTKTWTLPLRRWKHGDVFIDIAPGLSAAMSDRIVRANAS